MTRKQVALLWLIGGLWPLWQAVDHLRDLTVPYDFDIFWAAAQQSLTNVYHFIDAPKGFAYPPPALFVIWPFGQIARPYADVAWLLLSAICFMVAASPYMKAARLPSVLAILTPSALLCFSIGQTSLFFGALWLMAFRGRWWAVPLLALKPTTGFLAVLSLRTARDWAKALALGLSGLLVSVALLGPGIWGDYFAYSVRQAHQLGGNLAWVWLGVAPLMSYGWLGWLSFGSAALLMLVRRVNVFTAATATMLITPYALTYDLTVVSLGFALALVVHWTQLSNARRAALFGGWMAAGLIGKWLMPPLLLWGLWALVNLPDESDGAAATKD